LLAARQARGWSVDQLVSLLTDAASRDGTGRGTWDAWRLARSVRDWENGHGTPGERYVCLLCEVFGATPGELGLRWNLGAYKARHGAPVAARLTDPEIADRRAARDWDAAPLGEVIRAARFGDSGAADALMFAMMQVKWSAI
jgi:transcriptional regulator with XRE-family HTH domain